VCVERFHVDFHCSGTSCVCGRERERLGEWVSGCVSECVRERERGCRAV